jgi:hypothetical protein
MDRSTPAAIELDEIDHQYDEMLRHAPDDWYAMLDDESGLVHAPTWAAVAAELGRRGVSPADVLIMKSPGRSPYLVL